MFGRAVTPAAVAAIAATIWLLSSRSIAQGAPTPAGEPNGESNIVLNRQLASMVFPPTRSIPVHPLVSDVSYPRTAVDQQRKPDWLSNPIFLAIASHFTSAERILHYRRAGIDANFWGILNRGRTIRLGFSVRL
jgi:hypothetical protein